MRTDVTINGGEFYVSVEPKIIYTLIGSCVAVCLFDSQMHIGGMNHFLLPGNPDMKSFNDSARYGINAMELLINDMMSLGADRRQFMAKVFGGGHILQKISTQQSPGPKNAQFVLAFLNKEKIKVTGMDLGGKKARKIFFNTYTGEVFLKSIEPGQYGQIITKEKKYLKRIRKNIKKSGDMTFF
ncbi:MAG: chemotaxis protein CheD [Thermodesulfobacteriota bacterium]|nr:chemotaxis protein CheD [Thermodesulfobacteriota bacterium]